MNLYATPTEIKAAMPDGIRSTTSTYDALILRLAEIVSRFIDRYCRREFYPKVGTYYYDGKGLEYLWIPDLITLTTLSYSTDDGATYTALTESGNLIQTVSDDYNDPRSKNKLWMDANGDRSTFPVGQRSVKIVGVWGYADDIAACFEDSMDDVEDNPLTSSATSITVNDADGTNQWGLTPRFAAGQLIRVGSEYIEVTATNTTTNALTVVRGRNGSTAASATQNTDIYLWRPPEPVKQACIIQAIRQMERGFQGFGDARATAEIGQILFVRQLDPEVIGLLSPYRRSVTG